MISDKLMIALKGAIVVRINNEEKELEKASRATVSTKNV